MRMFVGNNPVSGSGREWKFVKRVKGVKKERFNVWRMTRPNDKGWLAVKVCAVGEVANKANYWLQFNGKRFCNNSDTIAMRIGRPDLLKEVVGVFVVR